MKLYFIIFILLIGCASFPGKPGSQLEQETGIWVGMTSAQLAENYGEPEKIIGKTWYYWDCVVRIENDIVKDIKLKGITP